MGLHASKEAAAAHAKEIATIKAVAASLEPAGAPFPAKQLPSNVSNPLVQSPSASPPSSAAKPQSLQGFVTDSGADDGTTAAEHREDASMGDPLDSLRARSAKLTPSDFVLLKTIGQGSFGLVLQVRKRDDSKIYAMKVLKKEKVLQRKQYDHTLSERRILERIDHPFIVSLRFAFQTEHKLYMVFDFFNGGELFNYLSTGGAFGEDRARFYAAEIVLGLEYLHSHNIVYRDLKAENIVLDHEGHVRITDFGLAKDNVKGDTITSICGTPEYLAPEVIRRRPYGPAVDWWSLGTLLFEMLAGYPPFYDKVRQVMYRKILSAEFHAPDDMSRDAADLCERFLAREPTERLGYRGASEVKAHKFFRNIDWDALARKELSPPWVPPVLSAHDVSQIAPQWTDRAPKITESPEGLTLRDTMAVQETPPSFRGFTFAHEEVFGAAYRVSVSDSEDESELETEPTDRDGGAW